MGLFGGQEQSHMNSRQRAAWAAEFDIRIKSSRYAKRKMRGEWQVADDDGNRFWRNGNACCGCGKHDAAADHHTGGDWQTGPQWSGRP